MQKLKWTNKDVHEVMDIEAVLLELAENESSFILLVSNEVVTNLIDITFDPANDNNTQALTVFSKIVTQFQEF